MPNTGPVSFAILNQTGYQANQPIFNSSNLPLRGGSEDSANDGSGNFRPRNLPTTIRVQANFSVAGILTANRVSSTGTTTDTVYNGAQMTANTGYGPFDFNMDVGES